MADMKNMLKLVDKSMRQKLFFYELCKSGVVVFDLKNPLHFKVLMQMVGFVRGKFDEGDYAGESCMEKMELVNGRMLDALILKQIIRHAIKLH